MQQSEGKSSFALNVCCTQKYVTFDEGLWGILRSQAKKVGETPIRYYQELQELVITFALSLKL